MGIFHHLLYLLQQVLDSTCKSREGLKGLSYLILSNGFQIVDYQFWILNGSNKMRNFIQIALKSLFFCEISEKLPSS